MRLSDTRGWWFDKQGQEHCCQMTEVPLMDGEGTASVKGQDLHGRFSIPSTYEGISVNVMKCTRNFKLVRCQLEDDR